MITSPIPRSHPPSTLARQGKVSLGALIGVILVLSVLAAGAWVYYHFTVGLQLPQERSLTIQGKTLQVRLESCGDAVIKYTLLADGTTRYAAIDKLSDSDQRFIQQLHKSLSLDFPLEMPLDQGDGQPAPARIEGHNDDWVKYTLLADHSTHYLPLTSLSASDQEVVQKLPTIMECDFPLSQVMTSQQGQSLPATIVGRTPDLVKFKTNDGMNLFYPINELSAVDQKLIRLFLPNSAFGTHSECLLTDKDGHALNVRLEGRSVNIVQYTLLSDGLIYYLPIVDLSLRDQQLVRLLAARLNFTFPLEYNLTDVAGKPLRVRLEGRTDTIVKYTLLSDGREYFLPLNTFAPQDQKFLQTLPANLKIEFPLNYILTLQTGENLDARIMGRNAISVNFQLADGKAYVYPLAKLSSSSREFLLLLPANQADGTMQAESPLPPVLPSQPTAAPSPPPAPVAVNADQSAAMVNTQLNELHAELSSLVHNTEQLQQVMEGSHSEPAPTMRIGSSSASTASTATLRNSQLSQIEDNDNQIETICKAINAILSKDAKPRGVPLVQSWWSQVMQAIKHDDQMRQEVLAAGSGERQSLDNELRDNQKSLLTLLERIYVQSGQYSP